MKPSLLAVTLIAGHLGLAACRGTSGTQPTSESPGASAAPAGELSSPGQQALAVGDIAPETQALTLEDGSTRTLGQLRGKYVVLYFYPMDDTPGCRVEAQQFRDLHTDLEAANAVVIGVSLQDAASHKAFIDKEGLPFHLAVDSEARLPALFGVPFHGQFASRKTVVLDPKGRVAKRWDDVTPAAHAREVLAWLEATDR